MRSMKPDRFVSLRSIRRRSVVLGLSGLLLLVAAGPAASRSIGFGLGRMGIGVKLGGRGSKTAKVAAALAQEMAAVEQRFDQGRRALPVVKGKDGASAHPRQAVEDLIDLTENDLAESIERVQEPALVGLHDWAAEEIHRIRGELEPAPAARAAAWSGPRAVAVVASLGAYPLPEIALAKSSPPKPAPPATVAAERTGQILDQVGAVIGHLLFLAKNDDLEVKLWVGSTARRSATFSFWPRAVVKGFKATPTSFEIAGKRDHVMRGRYQYKVSSRVQAVGGSVVESFEDAGMDLVNGSRFLCCSFEDKACSHVDSEKDCRASRR